jgi:hypothetical protein
MLLSTYLLYSRLFLFDETYTITALVIVRSHAEQENYARDNRAHLGCN